uniref:Uncharacterized protein n=1 Tax=Sarcophilus harrisii TaxID=9305 RepID=A0A7N4PUD6_SARHA
QNYNMLFFGAGTRLVVKA